MMDRSIGRLRLKIEQDLDVESPRTDCQLGTMYCWHPRYVLGDEQPKRNPSEWNTTQYLKMKERDAIRLPLHLYDHSGLTMNTEGFHCPWDSGQVGWIMATREDADNLGIVWDVEEIERQLKAEVEDYDRYLRGDVYRFTTFRLCKECKTWEPVDSCGEFYGDNWLGNGLLESLPEEFADAFKGVLL